MRTRSPLCGEPSRLTSACARYSLHSCPHTPFRACQVLYRPVTFMFLYSFLPRADDAFQTFFYDQYSFEVSLCLCSLLSCAGTQLVLALLVGRRTGSSACLSSSASSARCSASPCTGNGLRSVLFLSLAADQPSFCTGLCDQAPAGWLAHSPCVRADHGAGGVRKQHSGRFIVTLEARDLSLRLIVVSSAGRACHQECRGAAHERRGVCHFGQHRRAAVW